MAVEFHKTILKYFKDNVEMNKRGFFSTFFKTEAEDYTQTDEVEIDIVRSGAKVSPVLKNGKTGAVLISAEDFNTKKFKPPVMSLAYPVDLYQLMERQPGEKDYDEIGAWSGRLFNIIKRAFIRMHTMFKEGIELQAAQILQTGTVTLEDENGKESYTLDYQLNAEHFPTAINPWDGSSADPLADLEGLCDSINNDGKADPEVAIFGKNAWNAALKNEAFQLAVKKDGLGLGALNPGLKNRGGRYMGYIDVGTYHLEIWVYNDSYEKIDGTTKYRYLDPNKVIITAAQADLDFRCVFGGVPTLGMQDPFKSIMPSEVIYDGFMKVHNRVFKDETEDTYKAETKCRPLCIPVSGDRFGCLTAITE